MNKSVDKKIVSPVSSFRRDLKNSQNLVPDLLDEICLWMTTIAVQDNYIVNVQIVVAEVLNNIIKHGFAREITGKIKVDIDVFTSKIIVCVTDDGIAFIPPKNPQTPLKDNMGADTLPEGGFGWFLINEITSSYDFSRHENINTLTLNFNRKF